MKPIGNISQQRSGIDLVSIGLFLLLVAFGWLNLLSASYTAGGSWEWGSRYGVQLVWIGISIIVAIVIMCIPSLYYHAMSYWFYGAMIAVLLATLVVGTTVNGAKSWLRLGGFGIQPVEFAKIAVSLALAHIMSAYNFRFLRVRDMFLSIAVVALPMTIVILQNDVGSALVFLSFLVVFYREGMNHWFFIVAGFGVAIGVLSFFLNGVVLLMLVVVACLVVEWSMNGDWKNKVRYLAGVTVVSAVVWFGLHIFHHPINYYYSLSGTILLSIPIVAVYAYRRKLKNVIYCILLFIGAFGLQNGMDYAFEKVLKPYQQTRILILFGIENDTKNYGYNINQSKIAIGSGGFVGRGYMEGTQTKYDFVPEQSTDFIFCTVGEEWGFVGSTAVLILFTLLIYRLIKMGERQNEPFGRVYCYSVAGIIFAHVFINIGMVLGVLPVIGIPLPLFSYGGSSLLAFTVLFYIALRLDTRRVLV